MAKLVKVFVKGWTEPYCAENLKKIGHHSIPVRFRMEDGTYEWAWVRKNNVALCQAPRRKPAVKPGSK